MTERRRFRVGQTVKIRFGAQVMTATVIEDRGFIGPAGTQVVRVTAPLDSACRSDAEFEMSASLMEPIP